MLLSSETCPVLHTQRECPVGAFQQPDGARTGAMNFQEQMFPEHPWRSGEGGICASLACLYSWPKQAVDVAT